MSSQTPLAIYADGDLLAQRMVVNAVLVNYGLHPARGIWRAMV
jgi:hypothetical protein